MKTKLHLILVTLGLAALSAAAQVPGIISHQGKVTVNGTNYTGSGQFKFALVDAAGTTTYWSNDGTSSGGAAPTAAVSLSVARGVFSVNLGDTTVANMTQTIPASVFTNSAVYLRTWFNDGTDGSQLLTPDRQITSVGYALVAANFTGTLSLAQLPAAVLTNGASGVNLSGTFTGDGAGLTNIPAAAVVPPPPGMALIPAGAFTMGDSLDGDSDATPTISVTVSAFYLDVNLVSLSQWQSVYYWATNHGYGFVNVGAGKAANHPVQTVDWYDTVKWCNARSQQAGKTPVYYTDAGLTQVYTNGQTDAVYPNWTASGYRLPTEAEWEKAARGGLSGQRFPWGNVITESLANYRGYTSYSYDLGPDGCNAAFTNGLVQPYTSPVGYFAANGYGLYDMAGNVLAWCWDWYGTPYGQPTTTNPTGPATGSVRVFRGGGWPAYAYYSRCAARNSYLSPSLASSYIGFRCVRGL